MFSDARQEDVILMRRKRFHLIIVEILILYSPTLPGMLVATVTRTKTEPDEDNSPLRLICKV